MDFLRIVFVIFSVQFRITLCSGNDGLLLKVIENHERMIQRLEKRIDIQEKKITELLDIQGKKISELEKNCVCYSSKVSDNGHLSQEQTRNESTTPRGEESLQREPGSNMSGHRNSDNQRIQRLLIGTPAVTTLDTVAFYAYLETHDTTPAVNKVLVFDTVQVNTIHNAYNNNNGIFTIPESGIYVFTWTIECDGGGSISTNIVHNSFVFGSITSDSHHEFEYRMSTGVALCFANKGDAVFIKVHSVYSSHVHSSDFARSSFSGWKLN